MRFALHFSCIVALLAGIVGGNRALSQSQTPSVSAVHQAAMKRLPGKLGPLRGTIGLNQRFVLLTEQMIEDLKPPEPRETLSSSDKPAQ